MAKTKIVTTESGYETKDGDKRSSTQYRTSVPKHLAEFFNLQQGDELEWSMGSARDKIEVTVKKQDGDQK